MAWCRTRRIKTPPVVCRVLIRQIEEQMRCRTAPSRGEFQVESPHPRHEVAAVARAGPHRIVGDHPDRAVEQARIGVVLTQAEPDGRLLEDAGDVRVGLGGEAEGADATHRRLAIFARVAAAISSMLRSENR
jgi:hypothetical protein